ncbi:MAG: DMT family transporter [Acetobacteraceae bacterium]|nr:DMT family transporter [Acetobacteraceae bacterium]
MDAPPKLSLRAFGLLGLLAVLWGGSFLFVGVAVREWPPLPIVLARVAVAALALWAVVWLLRLPVRRDAAAWRAHLVMGTLNGALPFTLIVWAQGVLPAGAASILNATTPLWAVLLAHALSVERATAARVIGVVVGFAGVAVMAGADPRAMPPLAVAAMLGATLSYGLAGIWGRRFRALEIPPLVAAAGQVSVAALLVAPLALWVQPPADWPSAATAGALLALALLSTALGYQLYFRILELAGPVNLLLVTLLIPPVAIGLGWAVLGERLGPQHAVGLVAIALGLLILDGRWLRLRR